MILEADGSATATPDAGTPDVTTSTGAATGSVAGAATADPFAGLDSGTLEWIGKAGIKDVGSLASKARNAESLIGKAVVLPGDDAKPEDWDKFYGRLGRPEKPDGYEFKLPEGLPEDLPYDADFASEFKSWAHEQGLTTKQAQALHDKFVSKTAGLTTAQKEAAANALNERATKATETLEKLWGPADSDAFKTNLALTDRAIRELGGDDLKAELTAVGLLGPDETILSPKLADVFARVGSSLFKEDALVGGSTYDAVDNPFRQETWSLTEQMRLMNSDPNRARRLISATGKRPMDFGWNVT